MPVWSALSPSDWTRLVHKEVAVTAHHQQRHRGWLYTVDPVSASVVLVNFQEAGGALVTVVMGHAVEEVEVLQEGDSAMAACLNAIFLPSKAQSFSTEELRQRKRSLRQWLEKNRVPVEEVGEVLRVANVLTVSPPYGVEDCSSPNEIILARVQGLMESNPKVDGGQQDT
ncbi:gem-associated protein 6 [Lampris incognitus]|uniref:gem-associated protein 6 n=1 Tax=Lampris incognitus TaxID=2546036 RepID=UPI0024B4C3B7|nr:gem-associated protein 6 [Lampris incognitus]